MKSAEQKAKKVPAIRFAGFEDEWVENTLGSLMEVTSVKRIHQSDWTDSGVRFLRARDIVAKAKNEIITEPLFISQEKYEEYSLLSGKVHPGDMLVTGVGTIGVPMMIDDDKPLYFKDGNIIWFKNEHIIDDRFLYHAFNSESIQSFIKESAGIGTVGTYTIDCGKKTPISLPLQRNEQQKIGSFFSNIDSLISLEQKKYDKLTQVKKSMLEKMFPKEGATVPEIRFAGFTGDWVIQNLNNICSIITKQTGFDYSETIKPSLFTDKIDNAYSFIQNKDFEGLNINLDTDFYIPVKIAEKFPKITLDQPSLLISISGRIGNVGLFSLDTKAFIGGAVGICKLNNVEDGKIALFELQSPTGQLYFKSLIKASSHANITVEDIRQIVVTIPKEECEKKKINQYFSQLDSLISLQQRKLEKLKNIKKSLLEKMFV